MTMITSRNAPSGRLPRVAVLSAHSSPLAPLGGRETGGMNVYVRELSRELGARGYAVDVFTRRAASGAPEVQPIGPNARVIHIDAGPAEVIAKDEIAAHLPQFEANLLAFIERDGRRYDLVHSHYWMSGWLGVRLSERWRVPHVAMFHTLGEVKNRARITEHETIARIDAERAVAATADAIVVASAHERDLLDDLYGVDQARVSVVPCGVDLDLFSPIEKEEARHRLHLTPGERIILFVGRIEPLKGIDVLIGAAAQLHEDENFRVLIVGGECARRRRWSSCARWPTGSASSITSHSSARSTTQSCRCTTTPRMSASCRRTTKASAWSRSSRWLAVRPLWHRASADLRARFSTARPAT